MSLTLISCDNNETNEESINVGPSPSTIYNQEVVDEKYLKERISDASAIYYKSSIDGEFGDDNYLFETTILPSEYTEVEYIESTGNNYIDTGIECKDTLSFDLKFSDWKSGVNCGGVFGTDGWLFSIERRDYNVLRFYSEEKESYSYKKFSTTKEYTIQCSKDNFVINGESKKAKDNSGNFASSNMFIFKSYLGYCICKLYYFKIYDNNTIVRNYIPCYRNLDGKVGLYDLVSKTFFTDETNRFLYKSLNLDLSSLPTGYQQVEYVEATGDQRVLTDISLHGSDTIEMAFESKKFDTTSTLWCSRNSVKDCSRTAFYISETGIRTDYNDEQYSSSYAETDAKIIVKQTNGETLVNDNIIATYSSANFFANNYLQFFASYYEDEEGIVEDESFGNFSYIKFYYFKVDDVNGNTIFYLIPCIRNEDNEIGLYDLVNNKFYKNLTESPLIAGENSTTIDYQNDITNEYKEIDINEYSYSLHENEKVVKRMFDGSIGILNTISKSFTILVDNSFNFKCGEVNAHYFDEGTVITNVSEKQDGDIVYKCKICGKEVHKIIDKYSYAITFEYDEGVDYIKVYKGYDFSSYERANVAYTRNKNTNNFSKIEPTVYIEIVYKNGYTLDKISTSGTMYSEVEQNIYCFSYIKTDKKIKISTK